MNAQIAMDREVGVSENSIVYDFETKKLLTKKEVKSTMIQSKGAYVVKEYDEHGKPKTYYYDRGISIGERLDKRIYFDSLTVGEKLPPFIAASFEGESVYIEDYLGKSLVMAFELLLDHPMFKTDKIETLASTLAKDQNSEMVLFVSYDVNGSETLLKDKNFKAPIIPDALGFCEKYSVFNFPTYILVDKKGVYRGTFNELEDLLKAM